MSSARRAAGHDELVAVLAPVIAAAGLDLEEVTISTAGRRRVLRVVVDSDGGVDLDAIAAVSRAVSATLDRDEVLGEMAYTLEVTSPGVTRPLTAPRHYRRALGRLVTLDTTDGRTLRGRVRSIHDDGIELEVGGHGHELRWEALRVGHVEVEFSRPEGDVAGHRGRREG
jgi:ribosome maturation factor RimP